MNNNLLIIINYLFLILILTVTFAITPYVIRKNIAFGIKIPLNQYNNALIKKVRDRYRNTIITYGIVLSLIFSFLINNINLTGELINVFEIVIVILFFIGYFIIYLISHRRIRELKIKSNWQKKFDNKITIDTTFRKKKIVISKWWFILYVIIILTTIIISVAKYEGLPQKLPIHFNAIGEADIWASKFRGVMYTPTLQLVMLLIMVFVYYVIIASKQELTSNNPINESTKNIKFRYIMSKFTIVAGLILEISLLFNQLYVLKIIENKLLITLMPLFASVTIICILLTIAFRIGQGGWKIGEKQDTDDNKINREDDKYWKLGMIYFNPNDPAIFIEKRFGIGWTHNMARPESWIILIGLIIIITVITKI